jgi:hypothetical protein
LLKDVLGRMAAKLGSAIVALRRLESESIAFELRGGHHAAGPELCGAFEVGAGTGEEDLGTLMKGGRLLDGGLGCTNPLLELLSRSRIKKR